MEHTFLAALAAIFVTAAAVVFAMTLSKAPEKTGEAVFETAVSKAEEPQKTMLGVFEGKLAVFEGESSYPNRVFDFMVRTLPPKDQKALSEGITVFSEEELLRLLEDYMS